MVTDKKIEKLDNSAVQLTLTIPAENVAESYESLVKKYARTAQIKGFRKGKVPRNILERKFGEAFRAETLEELVQAGLGEAIESADEADRPLPYARPTLVDNELELKTDQPLTFSVTYDVFPTISLGTYTDLEISEVQVKISKADEDRDIEELRQQNAMVIDKESGSAAEEDLATITLQEVDSDDAAIDGTRQEDVGFTIGHGHNLYHIDTEVVGMNVGDTKIIEKEYADDFEHEELAGSTRRVQVELTKLRQRDVPDLDDEFAQDVSDEFETLDDLRKDVRSKLEKTLAGRIRAKNIDQLMTQVVESSTLEVPGSMIDAELQQSWMNMAQQYRVTAEQLSQLLELQGKTQAEVLDEWRPAATERIKRSLLVQKMIEAEKIEITPEAAEAEIRKDAEERKADADQIVEYYKSQGMLNYVQQEVAERTLFDSILEQSKIKKGEKLSYVDVLKENE